MVVSGTPSVGAKMSVPLTLDRVGKEESLIPIVVEQSNLQQEVQFNGEEHSTFTKNRCEKIGSNSRIVEEVRRKAEETLEINELFIPFQGKNSEKKSSWLSWRKWFKRSR